MTTAQISDSLDWMPARTSPADQLDAAYTHARAAAVPLINASWNARSHVGRTPALLLNLRGRPDVRAWLARIASSGSESEALAERAEAMWDNPRAASRAAREASEIAGEGARRTLALVCAAGRWDVPPPTSHATCAELPPLKLAAMAAWQHLARSYDMLPVSPAAQSWISDCWRAVWRSWPDSPSQEPRPAARELARQAGESLVREIDPHWAGSVGIDLPPGYEALHALGVAQVWLDAQPGAPCAWVRLVPADGRGGLVMPFSALAEPPASWRLVLRWDARVELQLLLLAILRDWNRAGVDQVLVRPASEEPADQRSAPRAETSGPRRRNRTTTALPRGTKEIIRLDGSPRSLRLRGQYVTDEERAEIERQVADLQHVRAHFYRFAAERPPRRPRPELAELWAQLTDAEKLLHFRTTELPANTTVRGLKKLPDGRWSFRYQRGQYDSDRAPRRIVAQGALLVAGALKLIREESSGSPEEAN